MSYQVFISVGQGKNRATMGSIPLPSKTRVERYIKKNPLVTGRTNVKVTNLKTNKTIIGKPYRFSKSVLTGKYKY